MISWRITRPTRRPSLTTGSYRYSKDSTVEASRPMVTSAIAHLTGDLAMSETVVAAIFRKLRIGPKKGHRSRSASLTATTCAFRLRTNKSKAIIVTMMAVKPPHRRRDSDNNRQASLLVRPGTSRSTSERSRRALAELRLRRQIACTTRTTEAAMITAASAAMTSTGVTSALVWPLPTTRRPRLASW